MTLQTLKTALSALPAMTTEPVLKRRGLTRTEINEAIRHGYLRRTGLGLIHRTQKPFGLIETEEFKPGDKVQYVKDGKILKRVVVSKNGSRFRVAGAEGETEEMDAAKLGRDEDDKQPGASAQPQASSLGEGDGQVGFDIDPATVNRPRRWADVGHARPFRVSFRVNRPGMRGRMVQEETTASSPKQALSQVVAKSTAFPSPAMGVSLILENPRAYWLEIKDVRAQRVVPYARLGESDFDRARGSFRDTLLDELKKLGLRAEKVGRVTLKTSHGSITVNGNSAAKLNLSDGRKVSVSATGVAELAQSIARLIGAENE